jgi:hypothetical protein
MNNKLPPCCCPTCGHCTAPVALEPAPILPPLVPLPIQWPTDPVYPWGWPNVIGGTTTVSSANANAEPVYIPAPDLQDGPICVYAAKSDA